MVLPPDAGRPAAESTAASTHAAKQGLEKVAEAGITRAATGILETGVPVRRGTKLLSGLPVLAELIVGGALLGILQDFVGLAQFLEARFCIRFLADVRMVLAGELAVGPFYVFLGCVSRYPESFVVV
jgi:hypothetical protein